tara:strand:+ start:325 stop:1629 length:1305 start_codon:yes stop_codon:yes gene_type:complete
LGIATYERPYDLKQRRENLSLEDGPAEEIIGAKGNVLAGLMAPTGGGSSEPERTFVGPQPEFEGFNEDEKSAMWELEKIGYKSRLEKMTSIVDDMDEGTAKEKPEKVKTKVIEEIESIVPRRKSEEKQVRPGKPIANIMSNQQMTEGYPGRSGGVYQQSFFGEKVNTVKDEEHETNITFEELEAAYSSSPFNKIPEEEIQKTKKNYSEFLRKREKLFPQYATVKKVAGTSNEWLIGLKEIITQGEADSYDTISRLHKNKPPKRLTEMKVKELKTWMEEERDAGAESTASGQYQINYVNLGYLMNKGVLKPDQIFDEDTQDKAYRDLLDKRKFSRFENAMKQGSGVQDPSGVKGLSDKKVKAAMDMQLRLAKEWGAIPIPYDLTAQERGYASKYPNGLKKGQSYYEGKNNKVPRVNKGVDFLSYLLSYMEIQEKN